jgi:hypothetical protein
LLGFPLAVPLFMFSYLSTQSRIGAYRSADGCDLAVFLRPSSSGSSIYRSKTALFTFARLLT